MQFRLNGDAILTILVAAAALFIIGLIVAITVELYHIAAPSIFRFGPAFLSGEEWEVNKNEFGALPFIYGTLVTSAIAILIGFPISLGVAIFISEKLKSHRMFGYSLGTVVDLLAAVPSVVYGLWGVFVLVPLLRDYIEKPLNHYLGFIPLFSGHPEGFDFFSAGIILAIMIIPTMSAVSRDVLKAVPNNQREAMYSLGATDWEVTQKSVLPYARSGIFGGFILGLGRAFGETMAVVMVIGNIPNITANLFSPGYTLSSLIANEFGESTGLYESSIIEIALILFAVALLVNFVARFLLWRMSRGMEVKV
ncbi:MAG TPA: phosphate ABC transporter permease subunit PstC [Candidatus Limnocylindrales bacterium]|nr:phosphate ABC transporter permease subunit PstC [Candidatus Limnocylindrales bacterium]